MEALTATPDTGIGTGNGCSRRSTKTFDANAEILKRRPPEDTKFIQQQIDLRNRISKISRAAAQMHSDIEDLTIDNIDSWKIPDFPK